MGRGFDGVRVSGGRGRVCRPRRRRRVLGPYRRGQARRHTSTQLPRRAEGRRTSTGARSVRTSIATPTGRAGGCASGRAGNGSRRRATGRHGRTGAYRCARSSDPSPDQYNQGDGENDPDGVGPCGDGFALAHVARDRGGDHAVTPDRRTRTATAAPSFPRNLDIIWGQLNYYPRKRRLTNMEKKG